MKTIVLMITLLLLSFPTVADDDWSLTDQDIDNLLSALYEVTALTSGIESPDVNPPNYDFTNPQAAIDYMVAMFEPKTYQRNIAQELTFYANKIGQEMLLNAIRPYTYTKLESFARDSALLFSVSMRLSLETAHKQAGQPNHPILGRIRAVQSEVPDTTIEAIRRNFDAIVEFDEATDSGLELNTQPWNTYTGARE